ncbi:unnamed protein product [Ilex paraguariensis]|uniref:Uncharacterized protein n=1 Tax=Ilex paraguariensis TaxID=185542 RepID=A0ABC8QRS3_9AQUA
MFGCIKKQCNLKDKRNFPKFEGMQCNVQFKKGWGPICLYLTKQDKQPVAWGEYTADQILQIAEACKKNRKTKEIAAKDIIENLNKCNDWLNVYKDEKITAMLINKYSNCFISH